jgi:hypothetical protein
VSQPWDVSDGCLVLANPARTGKPLLALTFAGTSARAVEPDPMNLRFEVFDGPGLHFLTLRVRVDEAGGRYDRGRGRDAQSRRLVCRSAEQA